MIDPMFPGMEFPAGVDPLDYMLQLPVWPPPPGADTIMTTNGPYQVWYVVTAVLCIILPSCFLGLLVYTRLAIAAFLEAADYCLFSAYALIVSQIVLGYCMVRWGSGVHQWQITAGELVHQMFWANLGAVVYCPLMFFIKTSILLQYIKLFAPHRSLNRVVWYGAWGTIGACFIAYMTFMF
ncbi:hypothetical protein CC86DRAFT_16591 [Ophiobolus disseminans]|uniref:Rhodopsin domain-containing protein n=1 Tax=Ophiobolus disseminans TaxID=1469910 RepID=A0A6A7AKX0_9PLEO|nr:hypothetical protein CC86DRAFT_16591 [Ophiobolus disseminans]